MRRSSVCLALAALALLGASRPALAQLAPRSADEWIKTLESPNRLAGLKIGETLEALKVKAGMVYTAQGEWPTGPV